MVEMRVFGLTIDPQTKTPIVILREMDGDVVLPIWVGAMEAMAVSLVLNNERLPRPLTHDLLLMSISALKAELVNVEITDLKDGVYYALLVLRRSAEAQSKAEERLREESPPVQPADAATDMVRKAGARKEVDMLNGLLSRHGSLPGEDDTTEDQKFRDLLRSLDPVSRRKM